ncbi:MAG: mycothiol system anti-sigma-R factor [Rhodospirillaceae bacterium]|jgi:anti-sigma factor (TIGR02949 family)|nr:mycothiol system anti-sigma-R factor [Rhodospirillaceae bacterium]MBT5561081.1 mycothiol system anti-sigma-R factor [Rhodospirillaceae bacterium]MBT6242761.1 mycothiol system anti-sigma-R factor [Rhodospirillaceae bacterium]
MTDKHDHSDKISCEDVLAHLIEFLNGEVNAEKQAQIDAHLQTCRGCYSRADFERVLKKRIKNANSEAVPDSLKNKIDGLLKDF